MIRTIGLTIGITALAACGDGRGTAYSSARAQNSTVGYMPVTPGAQPVYATGAPVLTQPIAVTPGAVPVGATAGGVTTTTLDPASPTIVAAAVPAATTAPTPVVRFATGPIYSACLGAGRAGATQQRCGCVQWVADRQLTAEQQRRGAKYFSDQHDLQEVRQSDGRSDAAFWEAWKAFGSSAGEICRAT